MVLSGGARRRSAAPPESADATADAARSALGKPALVAVRHALAANRLEEAERALRRHLAGEPEDAAAILLLASIPAKLGWFEEAEALLRRAIDLAPGFAEAESILATVLIQQNRIADALALLDAMLDADPDDAVAAIRKALLLVQTVEYAAALALYETMLGRQPRHILVLLGYGDVLKTVGRAGEAAAAFRRAIELDPAAGEAWWALASLNTVRFTEADTGRMWWLLRQERLSDERRLHLHFALGRALEDECRYEEAFRHFTEGNRIRRAMLPSGWKKSADDVQRSIALYRSEFYAARPEQGCDRPDPIFIVGMPRAGSTLVEQILASHPLVEGTSELPYIDALAQRLAAEGRRRGAAYEEVVAALGADRLRGLGEEYLHLARAHRKTDRPFFIDKMPANWLHVGLIHLILPNAKIVDARRHPLDCCLSNFRHHFSRGHEFAYSLSDLGDHYREYVRLLAHFDKVLPRRIYRLVHERLVEAPEPEIRALLDHLGLPFDPACLRFHENKRPVGTPSAEQVRRPLSTAGIGRWRAYAPWLGPLHDAFRDAVAAYPDPPPSLR